MKNLSNTLIFAFLAVFSALFTFGCASGPTTPGGAGMQTTTIYGRVVDEAGIPVAGVMLAGGSGSAISDANGFFIMKNATVPQGRALVIGKKTGYFTAAHAQTPNANGTRIDLNMMSDAATANVSGIAGGLVNVAGGATVNFAAGSFTDASGSAYTGSVKVSARFLDPKNMNVNFFDYFDGDMMAQQADGSGASLISSGVIRVELKDGNGNPIKLDPTKPATLNYPKPLDTKAPATMPLWYFDESLGMWKESGSATLNASTGMYTGTVTHFSDFNLDYHDSTGGYNSTGTVSLRIVCNTIPIGGVVITIVGDDNANGKYFVHPGGKTDANGKITFVRFPANRPVQITVLSNKNSGLFFMNNPITTTIMPGDVKDLGDISLDSPCPASVSGSLECNGTKVEGLVSVSDGTNTAYTYTTTGDFGVQAAPLIQLTVDAINDNGDPANTTIVPALASGQQKNIGIIPLCTSGNTNFLDITAGTTTHDAMGIALSPDGSRIAVGAATKLTVYDATTGNVLSSAPITATSYGALEFSLDGMKLLASAGTATNLYDVSGASATLVISIPNLLGAKLYDDATKIIAETNTGQVSLFSTTDGSVLKTLSITLPQNKPSTLPTGAYGVFGFDRDEDAIVSENQTASAQVWGITTDAIIRNFPVTGAYYYFTSSEDGRTIATTTYNLPTSCFDTKTGTKLGDLAGISGSTRDSVAGGGLLVTQNFGYAATSLNGAVAIKIIKISDGTSSVRLLSAGGSVQSMAASRNEKYLAAAQNGKIRIWKIQ